MATGTVKWFNDSKGYGFITPTEGGEDLFAHHTAIQMAGFKTLKEGQKVEFEVKRSPLGPRTSSRSDRLRAVKHKARRDPAGFSVSRPPLLIPHDVREDEAEREDADGEL